MRPLDEHIDGTVALVVDGDASSRAVRTAMLRDCGVGTVLQATRPQDARRLVESRRFDIVVCEFHFDRDVMTGLELMDDLRQAGLPPLSTVVMMISSEAAYGRVAEAAEAALDAYLIKPHAEAAFRDRLLQARQRKRLLSDIIEQVEAKRFEAAADLAQSRVDARGPAWLQAARIGAELWLRLGRPSESVRLLEAILQTGASKRRRRALPGASARRRAMLCSEPARPRRSRRSNCSAASSTRP